MSVVAPKNIKLIVEYDSAVRVTWTGASLRIGYLLVRPPASVDIISVKVIYSVETIIASKDINLSLVDDGRMSISR